MSINNNIYVISIALKNNILKTYPAYKSQCKLLLSAAAIAMLFGCSNNNKANNVPSAANQYYTILNNYLQAQQGVSSAPFSAISSLIQCNNQQAITQTVGTMQIGVTTPITSNSLFQIGSISKSFTSVVLLQLANDPQRNFSLKDTLGKWFQNTNGTPTYPLWANITIKELMNMSSGIPDYGNDTLNIDASALANPTDYFSPNALLAVVAESALLFTPGTGYHYSSTDYVLLGLLVQKITGNSPITEIQNRIFNKLNLMHTYFPAHLPQDIVPSAEMVNGYFNQQELPAPSNNLDKLHNTTWDSMSIYYTAGGIISTPTDINTYVHALFNPGPLLTAREITQLTTNMIARESPNMGQHISQVSAAIPHGYGLGTPAVYAPSPVGNYYAYTGATFGYNFTYAYFPASNTSIIFTLNGGFGTREWIKLKNSLMQYGLSRCGIANTFPTKLDGYRHTPNK